MSDNTKPISTGTVARFCHVSKTTVIRWIDSGRLPGYKIPGSRTRKVRPKDLLMFMRHYELPIPSELERLDVTVKTEGKQI